MFNGLASFFFGAVGGPSSSSRDPAESSSSSSSVSYTTTETDDGDWLLVESSRRRPQVTGSGSGGNCQLVDVSTALAVSPSSPQSSAPSSPTQGIAMLDGSWYITPPPCFTADSPVTVETSPMENLLIEHPSMSVYASCTTTNPVVLRELSSAPIDGKVNGRRVGGRHRRKHPLVRKSVGAAAANPVRSITPIVAAEDELDAEAEMPVDSIEDVDVDVVQGPKRSSAATVAARGELLLHVEMLAHSQKACRDRETRGVHWRQLDRHNKVLEYQSLGKRQRRKDFMKSHSGANNNRKC